MGFKEASKRKVILVLGDIGIILLSFYLTFFVRRGRPIYDYENASRLIFLTFLLLMIYLLSFYIFGLYNIREKFTSVRFISLIIGAFVFVSIISIALFYAIPFVLGRGLFLISLFFIGAFILGWRLIFSSFIKLTMRQRNILLVGEGSTMEIIKTLIKEHPEYKISGLISESRKRGQVENIDILGNRKSIEKVAVEYQIDDIVLMIDPAEDKKLSMALVNSRLHGINVIDLPTFYEHLANKLPVSIIEERFLYSEGFSNLRNKVYKRLKRVLDLSVSLIFIVAFLPLGMIIAFAIKVNSKGPIFLKQERIGEHGRPFTLVKFRTMVADAEKEGPKWTSKDDPRVTQAGKVLRKIRMDELPQFFNVLRGDMSLIGPRPEREFFIESLVEKIPYYSLRFSVKPGLTGWAQVNFRYGASIEDSLEKLRYDLYYIKNMSLFLDVRILLKTIRIALFGMGR